MSSKELWNNGGHSLAAGRERTITGVVELRSEGRQQAKEQPAEVPDLSRPPEAWAPVQESTEGDSPGNQQEEADA